MRSEKNLRNIFLMIANTNSKIKTNIAATLDDFYTYKRSARILRRLIVTKKIKKVELTIQKKKITRIIYKLFE